MKLLITTINKGLVVYDTDTTKVIKQVEQPIGILGALYYNNEYLLVGRKHGIYKFDKNFNYIDSIEIPGADNLHDIVLFEDKFYITESTGNKIIVYSSDFKYLYDICLFNETNKDTLHINSLKMYNGKFYLSMFKLIGSQFNTTYVSNSYIFKDIQDNEKFIDIPFKHPTPMGGIITFDPHTFKVEEVIASNLFQPHSICFYNGQLHYLESRKCSLVQNGVELFNGRGYARGLAIDSYNFYIGSSQGRRTSPPLIMRGVPNPNPRTQTANIIVYNKLDNSSRTLEIPGVEIYDVLIIKP